MKWFNKITKTAKKTFQIFHQSKSSVALDSDKGETKSISEQEPGVLTAQECLAYYQGRHEILQNLEKDDCVNTPKVSIIVLTYNNLLINQICLRSIYCNTTYPNFEVIVVDNASIDGTPDWLKSHAKNYSNMKLILNPDNRGFAAGNNQAVRKAAGEYLVFLNNDTIVTQGWVKKLLAHIHSDPKIGLVGPVTNAIGNEARILVNYNTPAEMEVFAADLACTMRMQSFDIRMLAFYCIMTSKGQYESLGGLDERFSVGMFEDDDLAIRYHQKGLRVICAEDVFIHHFQGLSFGKLASEEYQKIFEANRKKYEEKWGRAWQPYKFRDFL